MGDPELPDLRQWLRHHAAADARLTLDREAVAALADALGQARQSAERLRKQNAKLRKRMERLRQQESAVAPKGQPGDATDPEPPDVE